MTSASYPARVVLDGVPPVSFELGTKGRCYESMPFPSCLRACLEYLGEHVGCRRIALSQPPWGLSCAYSYLMGVTGVAFRLSWDSTQWFAGNINPIFLAADPEEMIRRAFGAVGYEYDFIPRSNFGDGAFSLANACDDEATLRSRIIESIAGAGRPVLGCGVVGPPEFCIITGYDENGDVLLGHSYFQGMPPFNAGIETEPSGYFRKRDWFKDTQGIVVISEKQARPRLADVHRSALRWGLQVMRTPRVGRFYGGLAAYDAWAEALLRDDAFPADNLETLWQRFVVHDDETLSVAEGRWYGSIFLSQMAQDEDRMADELLLAASCFAAEHGLMWRVWGCTGGIGHSEEKVRKLAEPDVRRQIVSTIRQARARDEEAAGHIERALARA